MIISTYDSINTAMEYLISKNKIKDVEKLMKIKLTENTNTVDNKEPEEFIDELKNKIGFERDDDNEEYDFMGNYIYNQIEKKIKKNWIHSDGIQKLIKITRK